MVRTSKMGMVGMVFGWVCGSATIVSFSATAQAAKPSPVGYWQTIDDETKEAKSVVQIVEKGGKLFGSIVKLIVKEGEDPNPVCKKCKDDRKDKPVVGMQILWGLELDDDEWSGGTILDPSNGKTYKCYVEVVEGGKKLKVRGYIGFSLLGRTQYWHKTTAPAPEIPKPAAKADTTKSPDATNVPQPKAADPK